MLVLECCFVDAFDDRYGIDFYDSFLDDENLCLVVYKHAKFVRIIR